MMNLSDKFGELNSTFGWQLNKMPGNRFYITVWTKSPIGDEPPCAFNTKISDNLHEVVDEAIILFKDHVKNCSVC